MNKRNIIIVLLLLMILSGCSKNQTPSIIKEPDIIDEPDIIKEPEIIEIDPIDELIKEMTLEEKIGQLLIVGIEGPEISDHDRSQILDNKVGGFIFFSRNIDNKTQVLTLLNSLKESNKDNKIPLFLSIDEEGGVVSRLSNIFKNLVDVAQLGHKNNDILSFDYGEIQGLKLSNLGFNINFAPVLDVNSNPNNPVIGRRAIDSQPSIVAQQGVALIKGLQSSNIITAAKHFPGHGDTDVDSHFELPLVDKSYEELKELELIPFKAAIDNGVDMVMVAHILFPQIDDNYPASISKSIINDILREELKYKGVVISDDITMGAIIDNYSIEEASIKFLQSGGDILLVCHGVDNPTLVINRIKQAIDNGEINIEEIDKKVYRILEIKNKYKIFDIETLDSDIEDINSRVIDLNKKLK